MFYLGTMVKNTKSSSPVLIMECEDPFGQTWHTPGFKISSTPSQIDIPSPLIM